MNINRRQFISCSTLLLAYSGQSIAKKQIRKSEEWESACKNWVAILTYESNQKPSNHAEEICLQIRQKITESKPTERKIKRGLGIINNLPLPKNNRELGAYLRQRSETGIFLRYFFDLVIELYYGTEAGWADLGFNATPQPGGFDLAT